MLENRPILKDRLTAGAVFSGIAVAAVAGFELLITGGFDVITPSFGERQRSAAYQHGAVITPWASDAYVVTPTSLPNAPRAIEPGAYPDEPLAGAYEDSPPPVTDALSDAELSAEIDALYAQSVADADHSAPPDKVY